MIDIVIPVRSTSMFPTCDYVEKCVESVEKHTRDYRLIFVDDNSDEGDGQRLVNLARSHPNSILVRTHFQRWFTRAVNIGLSLVRTQRAVVLNSDTVVDNGWLDEMMSCWSEVEKEAGMRVGLVGSHLSSEEQRRYQIANYPTFNHDYVTGHAWLLSMEAMNDAANFRNTPGRYLDETLAANIHIRSDIEICHVLQKLDWLCVKSFKSAVGHLGGRSWGHFVALVQTLQLAQVNERYS